MIFCMHLSKIHLKTDSEASLQHEVKFHSQTSLFVTFLHFLVRFSSNSVAIWFAIEYLRPDLKRSHQGAQFGIKITPQLKHTFYKTSKNHVKMTSKLQKMTSFWHGFSRLWRTCVSAAVRFCYQTGCIDEISSNLVSNIQSQIKWQLNLKKI